MYLFCKHVHVYIYIYIYTYVHIVIYVYIYIICFSIGLFTWDPETKGLTRAAWLEARSPVLEDGPPRRHGGLFLRPEVRSGIPRRAYRQRKKVPKSLSKKIGGLGACRERLQAFTSAT